MLRIIDLVESPEVLFRMSWAQERVDRLRDGFPDINEVGALVKADIRQRCVALVPCDVHVSGQRSAGSVWHNAGCDSKTL